MKELNLDGGLGGWDEDKAQKAFTPVAATSLASIGGGAVNGMSIQMKQVDILTRIEKNTRTGTGTTGVSQVL